MCRRVNMSDLNAVASAIGPQTKLVWLESPTNPRQQISDIRVKHLTFLNFLIVFLYPFWSVNCWSNQRMKCFIICKVAMYYD